MCIIIHKPFGVPALPERVLRECWRSNPHGAGYMLASSGDVVIRKGYFDLPSFLADYQSDERIARSDMVLHFRIATHGRIDEENCHPFHVGGSRLGVAHNGIIRLAMPPLSPKSDTRHFVDDVLEHLADGWLDDEPLMARMADAIDGSKLAFLTGSGRVRLVNEHLGIYDAELGCWFSNTSYRPAFAPVAPRCNQRRLYRRIRRYADVWQEPERQCLLCDGPLDAFEEELCSNCDFLWSRSYP